METLEELSNTLQAEYADLIKPTPLKKGEKPNTDKLCETFIDEEKNTVRFYAHEKCICEIQFNVLDKDLYKSHIKFFYLHEENGEIIEAEIFGQFKEEKEPMRIKRILDKTASMIRETYMTYETYFKEE